MLPFHASSQARSRTRARRCGLALGFLVPALTLACSSGGTATDTSDFGGGSGGRSGSAGTAGSSGFSDAGALGPVVETPTCSAAAKLVYVIDDDGNLRSFAPDKGTFATIGKLTCPSSGLANSMAVARDGTAYINYTDGALYVANVTDAKCTKTTFEPKPLGFGAQFGMGFATDTDGGTEETLYISDIGSGRGLAKVDTKTFAVTPVGAPSGALATAPAELTGTGDARLYGFFATTPDPTLVLFDKATGKAAKSDVLKGVPSPTHFAFSFWGGDFYFYTANLTADPSDTTTVSRLTTADGKIAVVAPKVGFRIVGAGVSTCAPTTAPR
ncbi:MAG: hypothetical protein U0169_05730 [Polyangiaceae bacterium]